MVLDPGPTSLQVRVPDLDFDDFQVQYQRWERGELTTPQVEETYGSQVLEMMQTQYVALAEMDSEQAGLDAVRPGRGDRRDPAVGDEEGLAGSLDRWGERVRPGSSTGSMNEPRVEVPPAEGHVLHGEGPEGQEGELGKK